jgi:hemolysin III
MDQTAARISGTRLTPRSYRPSELLADRWVHIVGLASASLAVVVLTIAAVERESLRLFIGVGVYCFGLLAMLACSALYSMAKPSPLKENLRRFDHAAIFIMIAGSYTPFLLVGIGGGWGWGMLAFVWPVAILGVCVALAAPRRFERAQLAGYLLLGWSIVVARGPLSDHLAPAAIQLLIAGGLFYTLGVPVYLLRRLGYHNAIWHALVLIGAGCHYAAVLTGVVLAS